MPTDAANLTFGIEIECYIPEATLRSSLIMIGGYHAGLQIPHLPAGWNAQADSSIRAPYGKRGIEIVSPVLQGAEGIRQVVFVLNWLRSMGAGCNESCGIHVHVGSDQKTANQLVALVAQHEKALFAASGKKGKGRANNHYCSAIAGHRTIRRFYETANLRTQAVAAAGQSRYQTLNLSNLISGRRPAVEFRAFAATFKTEVVLGYIRLCLGLVDYAKACKTPCKFESKVTSHAATGTEQMKALLSKLRWGKDKGDWGWVGDDDKAVANKGLLQLAAEFDAEMAI